MVIVSYEILVALESVLGFVLNQINLIRGINALGWKRHIFFGPYRLRAVVFAYVGPTWEVVQADPV